MNLYKKRFPRKSLADTAVDVLRLTPQEFHNVKQTTRHWLGEIDFHDHLPRHPKKKLLPSSLRAVRDVDSQQTLAGLMHLEHSAHEDRSSDFHMGGGIGETVTSVLSSLWNLVGWGPEFNSLFQSLGWTKPATTLTDLDRQYALLVDETYKSIDKRADTVGSWIRLPRYDSGKISAYLDRETKIVHVGVKGTSSAADVISDLHILGSNTSGHEAEIREELRHIVNSYGRNFEYDISGHSLGATEVMNILLEDDFALNKFERVNLYNPGLTPTHALDNAKEFLKQDRVHIFLNSGDILSNTMVSLVGENTNVSWANPSHSITGNHGLLQWKGDA
jgi:hypothetical protein